MPGAKRRLQPTEKTAILSAMNEAMAAQGISDSAERDHIRELVSALVAVEDQGVTLRGGHTPGATDVIVELAGGEPIEVAGC